MHDSRKMAASETDRNSTAPASSSNEQPTRRGFLRAGVALVPGIVTLHATPTLASHSDIVSCYQYQYGTQRCFTRVVVKAGENTYVCVFNPNGVLVSGPPEICNDVEPSCRGDCVP